MTSDRPLAADEQATINQLLRLAYERLVNGGEFVRTFEETHSDRTNERVYKEWLDGPPPQIVLFCRLMASTYRLCAAGEYNTARTQATQDLLTNRVPQVKNFVDRVPEIKELLAKVTGNDEQFTRVVYLLSRLLP